MSHIPANLLSLGALDFGMVVDGAVVMMENIVRHLAHSREQGPCRSREDARPRSFAKPAMRCSGRSSTPSPSLSRPTCPSSRCSGLRGGCSGRWPGRWRLRCWARMTFSIFIVPVLASMLLSQRIQGAAKPRHGGSDAADTAGGCAGPWSIAGLLWQWR